jgi:hypothetical protein
LVARSSPWRSRFITKAVSVTFVVDEVALRRVFLPVGYFGFALSAITSPMLHAVNSGWYSRSISVRGIEGLKFQPAQKLNQNRLSEARDAAKAGPFIFSYIEVLYPDISL